MEAEQLSTLYSAFSLSFQVPRRAFPATSKGAFLSLTSSRTLRRCGVYVLDFRNGDFYVGQATDVVRRHAQHCRNHQDITAIRFRPTTPDR
jgi:hypothetical protein